MLDRRSEFFESDRLANVAVGAQTVAFQPIVILFGGSEDDHRDQARSLIGANSPENFQSTDFREI
jgi:hypothetical protein